MSATPRKTSKPPSTPPAATGTLGTRAWTAGRWLLLIGGLAATYGVFFVVSMQIAVRAREVAVPDLRGRSVAEATEAMGAIGVTLLLDPIRRPDATVPVDHVLSQEPAAGAIIRRQRPVKVRVSDGVRIAIVPAVVGESERSAQILLAQDRITVSQTAEIRSGAYLASTIVAQDPPAKSQSPTVALLVNRGEDAQTYVMPDLIGTTGPRMADLLRTRKFRVTIVGEVPYPGIPAGTVVRQSPQAGFQIALGDLITIEVSR